MRPLHSLALLSTVLLAAPDALRGGERPAPVAEIVTFRLMASADPEAFVAAARGMEGFLRGTGSVVARTLSRDPDGIWTDHIVWTTQDAAETAAAELMSRPEAQPFLEAIDPSSIGMRHAPVLLLMD